MKQRRWGATTTTTTKESKKTRITKGTNSMGTHAKENMDHQRNNLHGASMQRKQGSPKKQPLWASIQKKKRITKGTTSIGKPEQRKQGSSKEQPPWASMPLSLLYDESLTSRSPSIFRASLRSSSQLPPSPSSIPFKP